MTQPVSAERVPHVPLYQPGAGTVRDWLHLRQTLDRLATEAGAEATSWRARAEGLRAGTIRGRDGEADKCERTATSLRAARDMLRAAATRCAVPEPTRDEPEQDTP